MDDAKTIEILCEHMRGKGRPTRKDREYRKENNIPPYDVYANISKLMTINYGEPPKSRWAAIRDCQYGKRLKKYPHLKGMKQYRVNRLFQLKRRVIDEAKTRPYFAIRGFWRWWYSSFLKIVDILEEDEAKVAVELIERRKDLMARSREEGD